MRGIKNFFYLLLISYFDDNIVKIVLDYNKRGYKAPFFMFMQLLCLADTNSGSEIISLSNRGVLPQLSDLRQDSICK